MDKHEAIDQSWKALFRIVKKYDIGLFVGAGLSFANELPSWESFTACLSEGMTPDSAKKLEEHGIPFASQLGVAHNAYISSGESDAEKREWVMRAASQLLISHNAALYSDKIDDKKRLWIERIRNCLYSEFYRQLGENGLNEQDLYKMEENKKNDPKVCSFFQTTNPALSEVVQMCSIRGDDGIPRVVNVLTTNLDSLLQVFDRAINGSPRQLRTIERATKSSDSRKTSLYHLHGYLRPHRKTEPKYEAADRLVLTDIEYTQRNDNPNHWAATTLHWALRECPFVFVGCSMTDELVRRALYRTREHRIADAIAEESKGRVEKHSRPKHFAVCQWQNDDGIRDALTSSYRLMDVNPLWIRDYNKLPKRLRSLREEIARYT